MAQPGDVWLGRAFLIVNSYEKNPAALECLPKIDEAAWDFWKTFYTLRFQPEIRCNLTRDQLIGELLAFIQKVAAGGSAKYVVFFFVGHGGAGDILFMQDGSTVTTEEIDGIFFSHLPHSIYRIFFIDACRGRDVEQGPGGYCPKYPNTILSRSTLPYHKAWTANTYGIFSKCVMEALLTNGDSVQSALQSVQTRLETLCQYNVLEVQQHTQSISTDIPTLSLDSDVKTAGGRLTPSTVPPQFIVEIQRHMEIVREAKGFGLGADSMGKGCTDMAVALDPCTGGGESAPQPSSHEHLKPVEDHQVQARIIGGGETASRSSPLGEPRPVEEHRVPVTFAQVIKNNPSIATEFVDKMCAEEIAQYLRAVDLIPERTKRDILERSRDGEEANSHLLLYLKEKAKEETVKEILKHASVVSGYGKMNEFAASILEKLQ